MNNWWPITLLCVDYKLASKAIANWLLQVLPSVIRTDHSIVNTHLLQDVVSDINAHGLGGALLSLYQKKAFDHVDWDYLLQVLERTNFGESS